MNTLLDSATSQHSAVNAIAGREDHVVEVSTGAETRCTGRRPAALRMFVSFVATMLGLRALTFGQQTRILPVPDVAGGGIHIHHFVWGILILAIVGFCGLMTPDPGSNMKLALLFGIGAALVVDEFALWLTLRDVYFEAEGAWSVELAAVVAIALGANFALRSSTGVARSSRWTTLSRSLKDVARGSHTRAVG